MIFSSRYIFSIIVSILVTVGTVYGQEDLPADTAVTGPADTLVTSQSQSLDTLKNTRIAVYFDYLSLISRVVSSSVKYEGGVSVFPLKNIAIGVEGGLHRIPSSSTISNGEYLAEGTYGKAGIDYFFINGVESKIYVGARYAMAWFEDSYSYQIMSDLWPPFKESEDRQGLEAAWYEVLFGTEGAIFPSLYMGWTLRYRIKSRAPSLSPIPVYHIPGYGQANGKSSIGFSLYLKYSIKR